MGTAKDFDAQWLSRNAESVARADALIGAQLADSKQFCEHTSASLCDEVFTVMQRSLNGSENSSILLLGEAGSGKTHLVEWCARKLRDVERSLTVLRAHGGAYATDVECVRHLASQATDQVVAAPKTTSFEQGLEWLRGVLAEGFKRSSAVLIILERFEHFCSRARQTLLYNLFDIAQEVGVRLCIIGTSEKMDVMDALEKRIKSRFSMRHLHTFLPTTMEDLISVLLAKLRPPPDAALKAPFPQELRRRLEGALWARAPRWRPQLELGRPVAWFLGQCLPVAALLRESPGLAPPTKRARTVASDAAAASAAAAAAASSVGGAVSVAAPAGGAAPAAAAAGCPVASASPGGGRALLLGGLAEAEHLVLLALQGTRRRRGAVAATTLAAALHELRRLHEGGGLVAAFDADQYCAAFDRLLQARLVELRSGAADAGRMHAPCWSLVDHLYAELVQDLQRAGGALPLANPLRALPQPVQQWVLRHQGARS